MIMGNNRRYISFDPHAGYPTGRNLYYKCLVCGDELPSIPPEPVSCTCQNIDIDVYSARMAVKDHSKIWLYVSENSVD